MGKRKIEAERDGGGRSKEVWKGERKGQRKTDSTGNPTATVRSKINTENLKY